jgi:hypothetical protein
LQSRDHGQFRAVGTYTYKRETGPSDALGALRSPQLAFGTDDELQEAPAVVVHVNFGVFTGREATPAEIDRLAEWLLDRVRHVTIVSEVRHEIDNHSEAAVHQVRIEVPRADAEDAPDVLEPWLIERAELWARTCMADRTADPV